MNSSPREHVCRLDSVQSLAFLGCRWYARRKTKPCERIRARVAALKMHLVGGL